MTAVIDSDQHLYESRTMWVDHIDPPMRRDAISIEDDDLGYAWLTWRDRRLAIADVTLPGDTARIGHHWRRQRTGAPSEYSYDEILPADFWDPAARVTRLDELGLGAAVLFPNFGLFWERRLSQDLPALTANMAAWNRWAATVALEGRGRLHPVGHLTLRDPDWMIDQLRHLAATGVRLAMIAPAPVDGRPLSHADHDRLWSAFVDYDITPCFHVADQPRVFDDCWYTDPDETVAPAVESVMLSTPPALAVTDLIANGTLARHPDLRIGIFELSAIWVPMYLLMLDGGLDFYTSLNGQPLVELDLRPSEYFGRQVRVSAFSYEDPERLRAKAGDLFMCCSDYPHAEGSATPLPDYERVDATPARAQGLFHNNAALLLGGPR